MDVSDAVTGIKSAGHRVVRPVQGPGRQHAPYAVDGDDACGYGQGPAGG
ncbi:hypothetical protein ACFC1B_29975 [Streptomyces xiamenensis]